MSAAQLIRAVEELGGDVTQDNEDELRLRLRKLVTDEFDRCVELCPAHYLPLPACMELAAHPWMKVIWRIGAPGPFESLDGTTDRRIVRVSSPTMICTEGGPELTLLCGELMFVEYEDADALARAMTLGRTATAHLPSAQQPPRVLKDDADRCGR